MKRSHQLALAAALAIMVTGAKPALAEHDEGTCFMHRSSSGYVKICTGDLFGSDHYARERREYYYEPVVYRHYYYGPPGHVKHVWHHKHDKHHGHHHDRHERCDHDDDDHRHDRHRDRH